VVEAVVAAIFSSHRFARSKVAPFSTRFHCLFGVSFQFAPILFMNTLQSLVLLKGHGIAI